MKGAITCGRLAVGFVTVNRPHGGLAREVRGLIQRYLNLKLLSALVQLIKGRLRLKRNRKNSEENQFDEIPRHNQSPISIIG